MNVARSPCKICASVGLTPVEQPIYASYDLLNCERPCNCQRNASNFVSLSKIKSFSCSVAQKVEREPKNIRTTASGICETGDTTWTCRICTLLNSAQNLVCEACESPYSSDLNSNLTPSVIIKVSFVFISIFVCVVILFFSSAICVLCSYLFKILIYELADYKSKNTNFFYISKQC